MRAEKIAFGHNVVGSEHFCKGSDAARHNAASLRKHYGLPESYFLATGRFIPAKNFVLLLQAYRGYVDKANGEPWSLVLCGDGEDRESIKASVRALGLESRVVLPGFVSYGECPIYYGLASVFVHPSTVEPWGLVVNEAMASGLPVLVSNHCGCVPELVNEGVNGRTFDPTSVEEMTTCMLDVHQHETDLQNMGNASRDIVADFGPERFGEGLWQAVKSVESRGR